MTRRRAARESAFGRGDLTASLVLVFPLLLAYEVGVLFSSTVNGVDVITRAVFAACGHDRAMYLLVHVTLALAYLAWIRARHRDRTLALDIVGPLVVEAALYALTLGLILPLVLAQAHLALGATGDAIVISLGAGVHEELVFRLGAMAGGIALLRRTSLSPRAAFVIALVGSAILFSLAHHMGAYGEPFRVHAFVYRAIAGALFGIVFWYRSFAHAVYAHVLYDLYVLLIR
ncbi:MAG TPA: CPBP family intramembrane glutamic endopeptidase [Kofleriaceae bacterium]|nr:CPBP family intramembrane glutamic endopeptidase [Kofleriaceae bacterium]